MANETIRNVAHVFPVDIDAVRAAPETPAPRTILREFSLNTSTHGIPGIARSQSLSNRVYWTISLLVFTGIRIYFIIEAIRAYFEYPIQSVVTIEEVMHPTFPAVSICNYSPLRYDRFIGPFLNFTNQRNLSHTNDTTTFTMQQADYIPDFFQYMVNSNQSLEDYFYSLDSMLLSCTYNGRACSSQEFVRFLSSYYGYCYTFNKPVDFIRNGSVYGAYEDGDWGILELELYVHSHLYVPHYTDGESHRRSVTSGSIA